MQKIKSHIKNLKYLIWGWITFFALSPCMVKDLIFNIVDIEYNQPLNKSKTTISFNSCQYSQNDTQKTPVVKQSKINTKPEKVEENHFVVVCCIGLNTNNSKRTSGNSPPKYILYKRLKVDLV